MTDEEQDAMTLEALKDALTMEALRERVAEQTAAIERLRELLGRASIEIVRLRTDNEALVAESDRLGVALAAERAAKRSVVR